VAILSVIFLGEKLNVTQIMSIIAIILGLIVSSLDFKSFNSKQILSDKGIPFAIWRVFITP